MELIRNIIIVAAVLIIFLFLFNRPFLKQLLVKFRGRTDEIAAQDAATPAGARDYYNAAIREREEIYHRASESFAEISGRLDEAEKKQYNLKKESAKLVTEINRCLDANDEAQALAFSQRKTTVDSKLETIKGTIEELKQAKAYQQELRDQSRDQLEDLKQEKERVLFQMEADAQVIQLHEQMDSMNMSSETDRMLQRVREGATQTNRRANGARISYESSPEAEERRLELASRDRQAREALEAIKRRRNGGQ